MKTIIGLVGEKGSGKQTFTDFFIKIASDKKVLQIRFSDILAETLDLWHLPQTRANLQKMAVVMNEGFDPGTLTNAVYQRISQQKADIIILDGVRWESDLKLVRKFPKNLLIYITADLQKRYQRLKSKSEKVAEKGLSLKQFMQEEKAKNEILIPQIGAKADLKIENNSSLTNLSNKTLRVYQLLL